MNSEEKLDKYKREAIVLSIVKKRSEMLQYVSRRMVWQPKKPLTAAKN